MGGGRKKTQTVGHRYYLGMHMAFCHGPVDNVLEVQVGDKVVWPTGADTQLEPVTYQDQLQSLTVEAQAALNGRPPGSSVSPQTVVTGQVTASSKIYINVPTIFGGDDKEGGVQGYVDFSFGKHNEAVNDYLVTHLGAGVPAFRGILCAIARRVYVAAMNPYIKPWAIYARRVIAQWDGSAQWNPTYAEIGDYDMNPAHIIRECLTNPVWGRGRNTSEIDDDNFKYAAAVLKEENFGLSAVWGDTRDIDEFIGDVLEHIDATLYQDRVTNKWVLNLIRDDVEPEDYLGPLPDFTIHEFNESNIISMDELTRPFPTELVNHVTVSYWNRTTRKDEPIILDNTALQDSIGGQIVPSDIDRTMICNTALAQKVAARELHVLSTPLISGRMQVNRDGLRLNIGRRFRLVWPSLSIASVLCRATAIDFGDLESGTITISFIEDVFGITSGQYLTPPTSLWANPKQPPAPASPRYVGEAPYWTIIKELAGDTDTYDTYDPYSGVLVVAGSRPNALIQTTTPWTRQGSADYIPETNYPTTASCRVPAATEYAETSTLVIDQVKDAANATYHSYAVWDNELVKVLDFNVVAGTLQVARGVLDTVPQRHAANSYILFVEEFQFVGSTEYTAAEVVDVKIITGTFGSDLKLADAPLNSYTFANRHIRPYPPGKFRVNSATPTRDVWGTDFTFTWVERNRISQTAYIVEQGESTITPEVGTTYTYRVRNTLTNAVLRSVTGLTALTEDYPEAEAFSDGAVQDISFEVSSVRDGFESWQPAGLAVTRHGFGFQFGSDFGGVAS